jgi:hypothetical protein
MPVGTIFGGTRPPNRRTSPWVNNGVDAWRRATQPEGRLVALSEAQR